MPTWATFILTACLVCAEQRRGKSIDTGVLEDLVNSNKLEDEKETKTSTIPGLHIGEAINIFPRYGTLAFTMKVLSSDLYGKSLFTEKSKKIFQSNSYWANFGSSNQRKGYDDHFLIDFCDSSKDLYTAYFDHFEVEGIPKSYKPFISSLSNKARAQAMGINPTYLGGDDFSYVLVRLFRRDSRALLNGALNLTEEFTNATRNIRVGYQVSAYQFIEEFGSHVIVEYELGDVVYQVFVFGKRIYKELKTTFALSYEETKGNFSPTNDSSSNLLNIKKYFTPRFALHIGDVKLASGKSLNKNLHSSTFPTNHQSIFEILKEEIADEVLGYQENVITGMRLKKITKALLASRERYWLADILDNTLSLYYTTL